MAEFMLKEKFKEKFGEDFLNNIKIDSAGLMADNITPISFNAHKALEEFYNKEFDRNRKCKLFDSKMIPNYDMILTVTKDHKSFILHNFNSANNVFTISEFVGEDIDITDPFMGDLEVYRGTLLLLDNLLNKLVDKLNNFGG